MENDLVMQMAIANGEELEAYRATRLTPNEIKELQSKYEALYNRYCKELERDLQCEIRSCEYAKNRSIEALNEVRQIIEEYFEDDI